MVLAVLVHGSHNIQLHNVWLYNMHLIREMCAILQFAVVHKIGMME
jgi:hypothetical protein